MALLTNTNYDNVAKNSDKAFIIFFNDHSESFVVEDLQTFKKTRTKIVSKWLISGLSENKFPFTHAGLYVGKEQVALYDIPTQEYLAPGKIVVEYESED